MATNADVVASPVQKRRPLAIGSDLGDAFEVSDPKRHEASDRSRSTSPGPAALEDSAFATTEREAMIAVLKELKVLPEPAVLLGIGEG
jgi:hypothetical protein